jgi:hypothetical protein
LKQTGEKLRPDAKISRTETFVKRGKTKRKIKKNKTDLLGGNRSNAEPVMSPITQPWKELSQPEKFKIETQAKFARITKHARSED